MKEKEVKSRSRCTVSKKYIKCGIDIYCDPGVIIGYRPERPIDNLELEIGRGARFRSGTVIYAGSSIGENLQTGHNVLLREQSRLGGNVSIWSNTIIDYGCIIGNNVKIHSNNYIPQYTEIEDEVFIAPGCTFANDIHPGCPNSKEVMKGPILRKGAIIGVGSTIIPKVTIGEYSLIGSGAVVTKDVLPYSVVVGNPARSIGHIKYLKCKCGRKELCYEHIPAQPG
jgi:acetyltransferase-like isoleucine patch superfamily enzyme